MVKRRFNEYVQQEATQPKHERRRAIAAWLREQLAQPAWPNEVTRKGRAYGYALSEISGAFGALRGRRDRTGRWMLPPDTASINPQGVAK